MASSYSQEFKDQVVELHRNGRTFMDLGKEFNLSSTTIANWSRAAERSAAAHNKQPSGESDKDKIRRLEKELARKEEELEILGKAMAFFARKADR